MENYTPNSHKYREEQKEQKEIATDRQKMQKVVSGPVKTKKKGEIRKFKDVFISEDASNIKSYIWFDVLVPAFKNMLEDAVTNGIRMILRGETGARKGTSTAAKISYNRFYEDDRRYDSRNTRTTRTGYSYDDVSFTNRGDAEVVLSRLDEAIETYGLVSVADLYDLAGITPAHTDYKYGWTNIRNAVVRPTRDGYIIDMPKALPIN